MFPLSPQGGVLLLLDKLTGIVTFLHNSSLAFFISDRPSFRRFLLIFFSLERNIFPSPLTIWFELQVTRSPSAAGPISEVTDSSYLSLSRFPPS